MKSEKPSNKSFGILFFIVFLLVTFWPILNNNPPRWYILPFALIFLILGLLNSKILSPFNKYWIKLGELLGRVIAPLVMLIIYFALITPLSLLVKLFGKDLLNLKLNKTTSYWIDKKKKLTSMKKQF
tara:strand:- start:162 stop:542 length:381 start_codon:yes stop_codon:yes gene_type:complete